MNYCYFLLLHSTSFFPTPQDSAQQKISITLKKQQHTNKKILLNEEIELTADLFLYSL